jgi:hypothetical protein
MRSTVAPPKGGSSSSKDLQNIERQSAKSIGQTHAAKQTRPAPVKMEKDKPNPKINFGNGHTTTNGGMTRQPSNHYKGRLKQKGTHHN